MSEIGLTSERRISLASDGSPNEINPCSRVLSSQNTPELTLRNLPFLNCLLGTVSARHRGAP